MTWKCWYVKILNVSSQPKGLAEMLSSQNGLCSVKIQLDLWFMRWTQVSISVNVYSSADLFLPGWFWVNLAWLGSFILSSFKNVCDKCGKIMPSSDYIRLYIYVYEFAIVCPSMIL